MYDEHLHSSDDEKEQGKHAKAAFCEKLLSCCACGKIYFSRHPISLLTLSRNNFYICSDCSQMIMCSRCSQLITSDATLVVEGNPQNTLEFLCPSCRDTVIVGSGFIFQKMRNRIATGTNSYFAAFTGFVKRALQIQLWPGRKRSKK